MAFITTEEVKVIRNNIKKAFPLKDGWKWSVVKEHYSSVGVTLMQFPKDYEFPGYMQVNHFFIKDAEYLGEKEKEVMVKVNEILHENHWDESDIMTDYFNCSYYVHLHIGKWDREAVKAKK